MQVTVVMVDTEVDMVTEVDTVFTMDITEFHSSVQLRKRIFFNKQCKWEHLDNKSKALY
jgi:hypothetical protein